MNVSHSLISTFEQCTLKYKYQYIDRIKSKPTIEGLYGSIIHEVLQTVYTKTLTLNEVLKLFLTLWKEKYSSDLVNNSKKTDIEWQQLGLETLTAFYSKHKPFDQEQIIALETQNKLSIETNYYAIRIDKISTDSEFIILSDYKTGKQKEKKELELDRQLLMYANWAKKQFVGKPIKLRWYFLQSNSEVEIIPNEESLYESLTHVKQSIQKIKSTREYVPNKSKLCDWCSYKNICPVWNNRTWTKQSRLDGF